MLAGFGLELAGRGAWLAGTAAHRVHARVEDVIRTSKDTGPGHFPSHDYRVSQAWLTASMIACILLAWLRLLALDGDLAKAEPKTLRPDPARRRPPRARRTATIPENRRDLAVGRGDHHRLAADPGHPASPLTTANPSQRARKETPGLEPPATRPPGPPAGPLSYPGTKIRTPEHAAQRQPSTPMKD